MVCKGLMDLRGRGKKKKGRKKRDTPGDVEEAKKIGLRGGQMGLSARCRYGWALREIASGLRLQWMLAGIAVGVAPGSLAGGGNGLRKLTVGGSW